MSTAPSTRPIVVGVDGSAVSKVAVDWAARNAAMRRVPLKLVNVLNPPVVMAFPEVPMPEGYVQWQEDEGRKVLDAALAIAGEAAGDLEISSEMVAGPSVPTLVEASKDAQLIVLGCRGRGALARGLLGSVSTGLVHHAFCPVAIIHDEDPLMPHPSKAPVVVGVDGSPASEKAVRIAFEEASFRGVDLVAVHAWSDTGVFEFPGVDWSVQQGLAEEVLSERLSGWQERYPDVLVRRVVVADRPAHQLLEQAKEAQLLVVGSHGRGGFAGMLLGSVSSGIAHAARMPVIIAR
ncbi:MAG TPA: universal stress protein [Mycobacterium sp.]|uniref:universal stress protein n=1 Tax=Mycolicibacterium sp. TaxID=2320850 RepID=UPI0025D09EF4|nr:universal stress protein [Mycolicibacterium sp.]HPX36873.1 universal stress protein [Mycobacterium sp.]HQC76253.1 universal stress protein [Mycobacterium sp.]